MGRSREKMKNRHNFITIGELSKLTGVNAKSIRYYEKIGVLKPAYVDPESGYRYYVYTQISLVSAIQFYVEMDIPLSKIHNYIDVDTGTVHCREQISYGIETAKQKIQLIENQIAHAEALLREIDRTDRVLSCEAPVTLTLSSKSCIIMPVNGRQTTQKYYSMLYGFLTNIKKAGGQIGCESGLLYIRKNAGWSDYIFVEIRNPQIFQSDSMFSVFDIPGGDYICRETDFLDRILYSDMDSMFEGRIPEIVILAELFTSNFDYETPKYELRWLAK